MTLAQLMEELVGNPGYIDGRRRYPRTVTEADAVEATALIHEQIDRACEARGGSARARGLVIACQAGCNFCCEQPVMIFVPEAMRIAAWLRRPENDEARRAFLEAYPAWRERVGDGFDRIAAATGDAQFAAHLAQWRKKILCAFNRDGLCSIYPVRPSLCRTAHAVGTSARCDGANPSGELPIPHPFPALDRYLEYARAVDRALHHALGGEKNRKRALCEQVYRLLADGQL
jgi:Fe-S-cluster containining protein